VGSPAESLGVAGKTLSSVNRDRSPAGRRPVPAGHVLRITDGDGDVVELTIRPGHDLVVPEPDALEDLDCEAIL
jgi:hypothetical protein